MATGAQATTGQCTLPPAVASSGANDKQSEHTWPEVPCEYWC